MNRMGNQPCVLREGKRIEIRKNDHVHENIGPPDLNGIAFIRIFDHSR
jgi:hypothetical protein